MFAAGPATSPTAWAAAPGSCPEASPAHIFRKNPERPHDRHLQDAPRTTTSSRTPTRRSTRARPSRRRAARHITLSGQSGEPGAQRQRPGLLHRRQPVGPQQEASSRFTLYNSGARAGPGRPSSSGATSTSRTTSCTTNPKQDGAGLHRDEGPGRARQRQHLLRRPDLRDAGADGRLHVRREQLLRQQPLGQRLGHGHGQRQHDRRQPGADQPRLRRPALQADGRLRRPHRDRGADPARPAGHQRCRTPTGLLRAWREVAAP